MTVQTFGKTPPRPADFCTQILTMLSAILADFGQFRRALKANSFELRQYLSRTPANRISAAEGSYHA